MELTPTLILNLALLIVPPVALVLVFRQWQKHLKMQFRQEDRHILQDLEE